MLNFGLTEMLVVVILAIVVVGPDRLPEMMRFLGRQYGKLMRASEELRRAFMIEAEKVDAERRAEELRKRREEARKRAEEARARAAARTGPEPVPREGGIPGLPDPAAEAPPVAPPLGEAQPAAVEPPGATTLGQAALDAANAETARGA